MFRLQKRIGTLGMIRHVQLKTILNNIVYNLPFRQLHKQWNKNRIFLKYLSVDSFCSCSLLLRLFFKELTPVIKPQLKYYMDDGNPTQTNFSRLQAKTDVPITLNVLLKATLCIP